MHVTSLTPCFIFIPEARAVTALLSLPSKLGEKSPVISKQEFNSLDEMAKLNPYIISDGEPYTDIEVYQIMMDNTAITTTKSVTAALKVLMGTIYVFNGAYPKGHIAYLTFLQKIIMDLQDRQPRNGKVVKLAGQLKCKLD